METGMRRNVSLIITLIVGIAAGFGLSRMMKGTNPLAGAAAVPAPTGGNVPEGDPALYKVPLGDAPILGSADAPVTIVEFSDYQCPFCSRGHATIQDIRKEYGNKVRVAMKQHPLAMHPRARPASLAALAAGLQGKYWEMHEKLFANQTKLEDSDLESYARDIGLDVAKWKSAMANPELGARIDRDTAQAEQLGANGTPAFFINGRKLVGAQPVGAFKTVIDAELAKADALIASGTPRDQVYEKTIAAGIIPPLAPPPPAAPSAPTYTKVTFPPDAPIRGPKLAKVTIVEWSDFQCPFCSRVEPTLKAVMAKYKDSVRIVFRNQPLPFHNNANIAAQAGFAANAQGKFWQMHDKMFENQQMLDRASLDKFAQEIGLNVSKFKADMDSQKYAARVSEDAEAGNKVGAAGTPTFFVNGRLIVGAEPLPTFEAAIDAELARANALLAKGVKLDKLYEELQKEAAAAPAAPAAQAPAPAKVFTDINIKGAPSKGPANAPVTIVAFSDFQCPFCGRAESTLSELEKEYPGKLRMVFMNQPLPFHENARPAANAALAANEQGKFWQMHAKLFANQTNLDRASLDRYAKEIGLDTSKFAAAMDAKKFDAQISAESTEGSRVGADGTPTFYINGRQLVGAQPIGAFKAIIDEEINKGSKR